MIDSNISHNSINIPADKSFFKALTCVPIIGLVPGLLSETSIKDQLGKVNINSKEKAIRLIEVKNQYKIASIIRDFLTVALIIGIVALNILHPMSLVLTVPLIGFCVINFFRMNHNNKVINQLKNNGFRPGMTVE